MDETTIAHIAAAEILLLELQPQAKDPMRFRILEVRHVFVNIYSNVLGVCPPSL